MPPAGAPPAAPVAPLVKRYETFGNVSLALAALEGLLCVQRMFSPLLTRSAFGFQRSLMPKTRGGPPIDEIMDAAQKLGQSIAVWEAVRAVPFLIASAVLGWIALKLRKGEPAALHAMRKWTFAALGVVLLSTVIQALATVPATMEYQKAVVALMPASPPGAAAPFDFGAFMSTFTLAITIAGLIAGAVFMSIWPIVAYVWAGKLIKESAPPQEV
jgi:hypothetical protein